VARLLGSKAKESKISAHDILEPRDYASSAARRFGAITSAEGTDWVLGIVQMRYNYTTTTDPALHAQDETVQRFRENLTRRTLPHALPVGQPVHLQVFITTRLID
jgi:hypothetical protein